MALAPGLKRRGGLFGSSPMQPPYATPGIGYDMTAAQQPMAPAKPKFFGEGGVGRAIAGNIGDFLLQNSGMDPIYQPAMQQRQAMAHEQQQREMQRRQGLEDWVAKQEYERANPSPVNNDTVNDFQWYKGLSDEDRAIYHRMKPEYRQGPDGRFYQIDIAPTAPTFTEDDWNKGTPVTGGPTQPASGGFR